MNNTIFIGRLTKAPELRYTPSGTAVANFDIAVDRRFKTPGQPEADFFTVVVWGKIGEACAKHLVQGQRVAVFGRMENRNWEYDGKKHYKTECIAEDVEFLDKPKS